MNNREISSKIHFLNKCTANIILQVPEEQDHLLAEYNENICSVITHYLTNTSKSNLELLYKNQFEFKLVMVNPKMFRLKFDYFH